MGSVSHAFILAIWQVRSGGWRFEASPGKKFMRPHLNQWWHMPVIPSYLGNTNRRIMAQASPRNKARPYPKNNQNKKGWW
jgi:hypothetical protein